LGKKGIQVKKIFFLSGLPRTGSTTLSALLNQNPDIYCSHSTDLLTSMIDYKENMNSYESLQAEIMTTSYYQVLKNMGQSFYEHVDKPYVFDKSRGWGSSQSLPFANLLNSEVKIVYMVRPILEILSSFISIIEGVEDNFIDKAMKKINYPIYRDINDARCDYLMSEFGVVGSCLPILANARLPENKNLFHFISYDDLVLQPNKTMSSLYSFLDLPDYDHNYKNIIEADSSNDFQAFGIKNLHSVNPILQKSSKSYNDVLSPYIINKYKNVLDFAKL
jgi:sulfotransferase